MKEKAETKEVAVKQNTGVAVPASLMAEFADSSGTSGFETVRPEDVALPFITMLQKGSPQVCRKSDKVEGAEEGDLYNTATKEVFKGPQVIIPCAFKKSWIEWKPRTAGGGFVKEHNDETILSQTKKGEKNQDVLPNGNIIVTTAHHFILLVKGDGSVVRGIISLSSTQLKKSRRWNNQMISLQLKSADGKLFTPKMFSHTYTVKAEMEENDYGTWAGWDFSAPQIITEPFLYASAKKFHEDCVGGKVKVSEPAADTAAPADVARPEVM